MAKINLKGADSSVPGQQEASKAAQAPVPGNGAAKGKRKAKSSKDGSDNALFSAPTKEDVGPDYSYQRIRIHAKDEVNPYADEQAARHAMDDRAKMLLILGIVLVVVFFFSATLPTNIFGLDRTDHTIGEFAREFQASVVGFFRFFTGADSMFTDYMLAVVVSALAGAALALSGGVYQGAMKNSLASPSTLGVMNGGTLGLIIYGVFMYKGDYVGGIDAYNDYLAGLPPLQYLFETYGQFIASIIGCAIVVGLIMVIAFIAGRGRVSNVSLIIAGQVFSAIIGVVITWIRYYLVTFSGDEDLITLLTYYQTSSFTGTYTYFSVAMFAVPLLVCMGVVFAYSSKLSILAFKDDEARSMGISTNKTRVLMVALCTIVTALVVAFCGPVGFVGFIVPHAMRKLVGPDFRYLLPACALGGAILVCAVHYVAYLGIPGLANGNTGLVTSLIGCVMFIVMALRQRGKANGDWF